MKYYTVWVGRHPGVYDTWEDCQEQVKNFPNARYKSFSSAAVATEAYRLGCAEEDSGELARLLDNAVEVRNKKSPKASSDYPDNKHYMDNPEVDINAWAVDAACAGNPGPVEYRGVDLLSGKEIFRVGPLQGGTNNMGEFLAIVHALALQDKMGITKPIYSDSVSGMAWVRNRCIKTTLTENSGNTQLFNLLRRGIHWLNTHSYNSRIMKWDTPRWGEIPADFGRKGK